jgi:hypothetical protein
MKGTVQELNSKKDKQKWKKLSKADVIPCEQKGCGQNLKKLGQREQT